MSLSPTFVAEIGQSSLPAMYFAVVLHWDGVNPVVFLSDTNQGTGYLSGIPGTPQGNEKVLIDGFKSTSQAIEPLKHSTRADTFSFRFIDPNGTYASLFASVLNGSPRRLVRNAAAYFFVKTSRGSDWHLIGKRAGDKITQTDGLYSVTTKDFLSIEKKKAFRVVSSDVYSNAAINGGADIVLGLSDTSLIDAHFGANAHSFKKYGVYSKEILEIEATSGDLITCSRGVLGTSRVENAEDGELTIDEIKEVIIQEVPAVELISRILTGTNLAGTGGSWPEHWHLGWDRERLDYPTFNTIAALENYPLSLEITEPVQAKEFIETQVLPIIGCVLICDNRGKYSLRRLEIDVESAPSSFTITDRYIEKYGTHTSREELVRNNLRILWDYLPLTDHPVKDGYVPFSNSISDYGELLSEIELKYLKPGPNVTNVIENVANLRISRVANPPIELNLTTSMRMIGLEVGDIITVKTDRISDLVTGLPINRRFEVQSISVDWKNPSISLKLFSTTGTEGAVVQGFGPVMLDSFYTSAGGPLPNVTNGVLTTTTTIGDNLGNALSAYIYYVDGDLTIPDGVSLIINGQIQLRVRGYLQVDGHIAGAGRGTDGTYAGRTTAGGGGYLLAVGSDVSLNLSKPSIRKAGIYASPPRLNLENIQGTGLLGIPDHIESVAGADGGDSILTFRYNGTDYDTTSVGGANGTVLGRNGASAVIITRGYDVSNTGTINLDGVPGLYGDLVWIESGPQSNLKWHRNKIYGGDASGGSGGVLYMLLDGNQLISSSGDYNMTSVRKGTLPTPPDYDLSGYPHYPLLNNDNDIAGGDSHEEEDTTKSFVNIQVIPPPSGSTGSAPRDFVIEQASPGIPVINVNPDLTIRDISPPLILAVRLVSSGINVTDTANLRISYINNGGASLVNNQLKMSYITHLSGVVITFKATIDGVTKGKTFQLAVNVISGAGSQGTPGFAIDQFSSWLMAYDVWTTTTSLMSQFPVASDQGNVTNTSAVVHYLGDTPNLLGDGIGFGYRDSALSVVSPSTFERSDAPAVNGDFSIRWVWQQGSWPNPAWSMIEYDSGDGYVIINTISGNLNIYITDPVSSTTELHSANLNGALALGMLLDIIIYRDVASQLVPQVFLNGYEYIPTASSNALIPVVPDRYSFNADNQVGLVIPPAIRLGRITKAEHLEAAIRTVNPLDGLTVNPGGGGGGGGGGGYADPGSSLTLFNYAAREMYYAPGAGIHLNPNPFPPPNGDAGWLLVASLVSTGPYANINGHALTIGGVQASVRRIGYTTSASVGYISTYAWNPTDVSLMSDYDVVMNETALDNPMLILRWINCGVASPSAHAFTATNSPSTSVVRSHNISPAADSLVMLLCATENPITQGDLSISSGVYLGTPLSNVFEMIAEAPNVALVDFTANQTILPSTGYVASK